MKRFSVSLLILLGFGAMLMLSCAMFERENEDKEIKVTIDQVPAAVRTALEQEAFGGTIKEIEQGEEHGRVVYESEITKGGKTVEVKLSANGKVLKRENEDEDKEDMHKK